MGIMTKVLAQREELKATGNFVRSAARQVEVCTTTRLKDILAWVSPSHKSERMDKDISRFSSGGADQNNQSQARYQDKSSKS